MQAAFTPKAIRGYLPRMQASGLRLLLAVCRCPAWRMHHWAGRSARRVRSALPELPCTSWSAPIAGPAGDHLRWLTSAAQLPILHCVCINAGQRGGSSGKMGEAGGHPVRPSLLRLRLLLSCPCKRSPHGSLVALVDAATAAAWAATAHVACLPATHLPPHFLLSVSSRRRAYEQMKWWTFRWRLFAPACLPPCHMEASHHAFARACCLPAVACFANTCGKLSSCLPSIGRAGWPWK